MKAFYVIACFICSLSIHLNAQNHKVAVNGTLTGSKNRKPLPNAKLQLVCSDSTILHTYSDSSGNYLFTKTLNKNIEAVIVVSPNSQVPYGLCPYSFKNKTITFPQRIKLTLYPDSATITKNITVTEGYVHYNFPKHFYFKKNSIEFSLALKDYYTADTALDCVIDFMQANPHTNIYVAGYSDSKEKNKQQLSEQRAQVIYDLLIKKGIDANRLSYQGFGDSNTTVSEKTNCDQCRAEIIISIPEKRQTF
jgi:outer membrane protein OmpA-like peptidoglycan-associated protein